MLCTYYKLVASHDDNRSHYVTLNFCTLIESSGFTLHIPEPCRSKLVHKIIIVGSNVVNIVDNTRISSLKFFISHERAKLYFLLLLINTCSLRIASNYPNLKRF